MISTSSRLLPARFNTCLFIHFGLIDTCHFVGDVSNPHFGGTEHTILCDRVTSYDLVILSTRWKDDSTDLVDMEDDFKMTGSMWDILSLCV
jgi:hypothetical protein